MELHISDGCLNDCFEVPSDEHHDTYQMPRLFDNGQVPHNSIPSSDGVEVEAPESPSTSAYMSAMFTVKQRAAIREREREAEERGKVGRCRWTPGIRS